MSRSNGRRAALALAAFFALLAAGCSRDKVEIQSNTFWEGTINSYIRIYGSGNKTYEIHGKLGCVTVSKTYADTLYLRLRVTGKQMQETTRPLGTLIICK